jgi:hypothetical protein
MSQIDLVTRSSVSTPATNEVTVYVDNTTKKLKSKDDAGVVTDYGAAASADINQLTGEVLAGPGSGSVPATIVNSAVLNKVLTGLTASTGDLVATDTILQGFGKLLSKLKNQDWLPTPTDGDVVINVDTTLFRDMYYNSLTINLGATLFTNGFKVLAKQSIVNNGNINREGNNASGITAGAALVLGTVGNSAAGGAGGAAAGVAGGAVASGLGGSGGAGGAGSGGAGGAAGVVTTVAVNNGGVELFQTPRQASVGRDLTGANVLGGGGGGGGGGDGTAGGGGGGGGGHLILITRSLTGTGTISAKGGNGGTPAAGNRGGGGGGGGGIIVTLTENDTTLTSLTFNVSGGLGGSGTGTGVTGNVGSNGRIYRVGF